MEYLTIPAGSRVLLGAPAKPLPESITASLRDLVANAPNILEAHLPQCCCPGTMEAPAQVLVVILKTEEEASMVEYINAHLGRILPKGMHLDILPLSPQHNLLETIRKAGCQLKMPSNIELTNNIKACNNTKHWWQFWKRCSS